MNKQTLLLATLTLAASLGLHAQTRHFVIEASKQGAEIQPTMYGHFFEDINFGADGGLYDEVTSLCVQAEACGEHEGCQ